MKKINVDVLVVGSGIAGLYVALQLAAQYEVLLVTKSKVQASNSAKAQGGVAVALREDDGPHMHMQDTLECGCHLNDQEAVRLLTQKSRQVIQNLIDYGVPFDRDEKGKLLLCKEGFHRVSRIIHAGGDATGLAITTTLANRALSCKNITVMEDAFVEELVTSERICTGALINHEGQYVHVVAPHTVLANGGCGHLFEETTNVFESTGDGMALAYRAGATLVDMEFVQFHPTALATNDYPKALISEAVRGEGATLINSTGQAFMKNYHQWADLAPRDVVARAIFAEQLKGNDIYLDISEITAEFNTRFPTIYKTCLQKGVDLKEGKIPITPAAHFMMGGVQTDLDGRTTVEGLFACGEVACTGVHGANRLASNSLLEGLVFAKQISDFIHSQMNEKKRSFSKINTSIFHNKTVSNRLASNLTSNLATKITSKRQGSFKIENDLMIQHKASIALKRIMWKYAGIVRTEVGLQKALALITQWQREWAHEHPVWGNMGQVAELITRAALQREESRGAHYREDYPAQKPDWQNKRLKWRKHQYEHIVSR